MDTRRPVLLGVFHDHAIAEQAIEKLQDAGFDSSHLHYSGGASATGFLSTLKNIFTGPDMTSENVLDNLRDMGFPEENVQHYAREHEAGRALIAVDSGDLVRQAREVLASNRAISIDMNAEAAQIYGAQEAVMPSNEEIQGIGDYSKQAGEYMQVPDNTRAGGASQPARTHGERPAEYLQAPNNTQVDERGQQVSPSTTPAAPGYMQVPDHTQAAQEIPQADTAQGDVVPRPPATGGAQTTGYTQTDNTLSNVEAVPAVASPLPGESMPENRAAGTPIAEGAQATGYAQTDNTLRNVETTQPTVYPQQGEVPPENTTTQAPGYTRSYFSEPEDADLPDKGENV